MDKVPSIHFEDLQIKECISNPQCELKRLHCLSEMQNIKNRLLLKETQQLWKSKLLKKPRFCRFPRGRKTLGEVQPSCLTHHFQPVAKPGCLIWKVVCYEGSVTHTENSAWQKHWNNPMKNEKQKVNSNYSND